MRNLTTKTIVAALGIALLTVSASVSSQTDYRFERFWPALQQPWYWHHNANGITADLQNFVYLADSFNFRVVKLTENGNVVSTWSFGTGTPGDVAAADDGSIYVVFKENVRQLTADGEQIRVWGQGGTGDGEFTPVVVLEGIGRECVSWSAIALAPGVVYTTDVNGHRVHKFSRDGQWILSWGTQGSGPGQFECPTAIAVDHDGNVHVADARVQRVQKFSQEGDFLLSWGPGTEGGVNEIAVDLFGAVYVTGFTEEVTVVGETFIPAVSKFLNDGTFITAWASGTTDRYLPRRANLTFAPSGNAYLFGLGPGGTGENPGKRLVKAIPPSGGLITNPYRFAERWAAHGEGPSQFSFPGGLEVGPDGLVYVTDEGNRRVQAFSDQGVFQKSWLTCSVPGVACDLAGAVFTRTMAIDPTTGYLYLGAGDIFVYTSDGVLLQEQWHSVFPADLELNPAGDILYVLGEQCCDVIQKFATKDGKLLDEWPIEATWGYTSNPGGGMAIDDEEDIFVIVKDPVCQAAGTPTDQCNRILKVDSDGNLLDVINILEGGGSSQGLDIGPDGRLYLTTETGFSSKTDIGFQSMEPDGSDLQNFAGNGNIAGRVRAPRDIDVTPDGRVFISDRLNHRVQVFSPVTVNTNNKAIILAGGGPYAGNDLWDATQLNANFVYRTLAYQGFRKEEIYYLSADTDLDLDGNGVADDIAADATNANFETAITQWATDADNLLIYLVDHGGSEAFRMSGTETLPDDVVAGWVATAQAQLAANCLARGKTPGKGPQKGPQKGETCGQVMIVYDACQSGSFLKAMAGPDRIIITSAKESQNAYFASQGSLSFSNHFWVHTFNGQNIPDSFELAKEQTEVALPGLQNPQLDSDGDTVANEAEDLEAIANLFIGNGTTIFGEAPTVGSVSPPVVLSQGNTATIEASDVEDSDGIARVWAVLRPPDFQPPDPENPVAEFPIFDLLPEDGGLYAGTYTQFSTVGTYQLAIYARDALGNTSVPKLTTVSVENPLARRAVIVAAGEITDNLWNAIERNADVAYDALVQQGYLDEDIYYLSAAATPGTDGTPVLANIEFALTEFGADDVQDLAVYMVGDLEGGSLRVNSDETLSPEQLKIWLDSARETQALKSVDGLILVFIEGPRSGVFLGALAPSDDEDWILIVSTNAESGAAFLEEGEVTFSRYFWGRVVNGATVGKAFDHARDAIQFSNTPNAQQTPQLDDTGNGVGNELADGLLADRYSIGPGILLAGDDPIIGSVSESQVLDGDTSALLFAEDVTTTGEIERVFAVITPPGFQQTGGAVDHLPTIDLNPVGNKATRYQRNYDGFTVQGIYQVAFYAVDTDGAVSFPTATTVTQTMGELPITLPASMAGSWFPAGHSGEGFLFEVIAPGIAVVYWFTYDGQGNQRWLFGVGAVVENRIEVAELLEASGGVFGDDFDPDAISFKTIGNAVFTFSSCDAGMVEFIVDGTPGEYNIKRITNIEGLTCQGVTKHASKSALHGGRSGSWFNPERSGEGYLVEIIALPDGTLVLVIYFFTFDPDGNLAWMVASGIIDGTDTLTMDVVQPVGGVFGPDFDPADVTNIDWGTMTFQLSCAAGVVSYDSNQPGYGNAERVLSRITSQLGVSCND